MKQAITLLFLLFSSFLSGQIELDWAKVIPTGFPTDYLLMPSCLEVLENEGFLCGITYNCSQLNVDDKLGWSYGKKDIALLQLDQYGNTTQLVMFGGTGDEEIIGIKKDMNGDILVLGSFEGGSIQLGKQVYENEKGADLFLMKLDKFFEVKWSKVIGDKWFNVNPSALTISPTNDIIISGTFNGIEVVIDGNRIKNFDDSNNNDVFLMQFNPDGKVQWANAFGGESSEYIKCIEVTKAGDVLVTGHYYSSLLFFGHKSLANNGQRDIYLAKYDRNGQLLKALGFGSSKLDLPTNIKALHEDKIAFSFYYDGLNFFMQDTVLTNPSGGGGDFVLCVLDKDFKIEWLISEGNWNTVNPSYLDMDKNGNIYTFGVFDAPTLSVDNYVVHNKGKFNFNWDLWIAKWDINRNLKYLKSFGGIEWEYPSGFKVLEEDEFVFTGITLSKSIEIGSHNLDTPSDYNFLISKFKKEPAFKQDKEPSKTLFNVYPTIVTSEGEISIDIANGQYVPGQTLINKVLI